MVVVLDTDLDPRGLLELCQRLEQAADRVREVRWGPAEGGVDRYCPAAYVSRGKNCG